MCVISTCGVWGRWGVCVLPAFFLLILFIGPLNGKKKEFSPQLFYFFFVPRNGKSEKGFFLESLNQLFFSLANPVATQPKSPPIHKKKKKNLCEIFLGARFPFPIARPPKRAKMRNTNIYTHFFFFFFPKKTIYIIRNLRPSNFFIFFLCIYIYIYTK